MREVWKDVAGYEGLYAVSDMGRVKRLDTAGTSGTGCYPRKEHILSQRNNNSGYCLVDLYKGNIRKGFLVHRLVAIAFLDKPEGKDYVNHIDENPQNNKANNLEWCTQEYNMNYGTVPFKIGRANGKRIVAIGKDGSVLKFESAKDAERKLGISNGNINDCLHGKRYRKTVGGFLWKFET